MTLSVYFFPITMTLSHFLSSVQSLCAELTCTRSFSFYSSLLSSNMPQRKTLSLGTATKSLDAPTATTTATTTTTTTTSHSGMCSRIFCQELFFRFLATFLSSFLSRSLLGQHRTFFSFEKKLVNIRKTFFSRIDKSVECNRKEEKKIHSGYFFALGGQICKKRCWTESFDKIVKVFVKKLSELRRRRAT